MNSIGSLLLCLGVVAEVSVFGALACWIAQRYSLRLRFFTVVGGCALTAIAVTAFGYAFSGGEQRWSVMLAIAAVGICALTDVQTGYVFDAVTMPTWFGLTLITTMTGTAATALAGSAVVGGALLLVYVATRRRGIGLGDAKLGCCIGAALGPESGVHALQAACILGGLSAAGLLATRNASRSTPIAFGPYLAFGTLIAILVWR